MKRTTLLAALMAAGFGLGTVHAQQSDPTMPDPGAPAGAVTAEKDRAYDDTINIEGPEERLHGQRDGDMEGQSENLRDDQLERAPASADQSQSDSEQPQIPDQSLGSVGHPTEADTTGQGSGLDEQPASAEGEDSSRKPQQQ